MSKPVSKQTILISKFFLAHSGFKFETFARRRHGCRELTLIYIALYKINFRKHSFVTIFIKYVSRDIKVFDNGR